MTQFFNLTDLGLASSSGQLMSQWLAYMQQVFPGYTPSSGNLEYILAQIFAAWAADVNAQASQGSEELFRQFGLQLMGVQPENGSPATTTVAVMAQDTQGYTLPVGTQFLLDNIYGFQSTQTLTIPAGSQAGVVQIAAVTPGSSYNGAGGSFGAQLNQQINWVLSVSITAPASGGADPETEEAYLDRLAATLTLSAPRPITAADYGVFALSFQPLAGTDQQDVGRASAIDGYEPAAGPGTILGAGAGSNPNTYNNEREVTVCVTDANGSALNNDTLIAIQAWLSSVRELNFIVNLTSPNYSPVYVQCSVYRNTAYSAATVQANVQEALVSLLVPSAWGLPPSSPIGWQNQPTVYYSVLESTIQTASGVDHIIEGSLTTGFAPSTGGTSDLLLPGPFPLPTTSDGTTIPLSAITVVN